MIVLGTVRLASMGPVAEPTQSVTIRGDPSCVPYYFLHFWPWPGWVCSLVRVHPRRTPGDGVAGGRDIIPVFITRGTIIPAITLRATTRRITTPDITARAITTAVTPIPTTRPTVPITTAPLTTLDGTTIGPASILTGTITGKETETCG